MKDEEKYIGYWSKMKLEIVDKYLEAYCKILEKREYFYPVYIDAFAGLGEFTVRETQEEVLGSPLRALSQPCFKEYYFIDKDPEKVEILREKASTLEVMLMKFVTFIYKIATKFCRAFWEI